MRPRPHRIEDLPEQYFTALLARVAAAAAEPGEPLIDLGRGNPDVPPPAHVIEALVASAPDRTPAVHGNGRVSKLAFRRKRRPIGGSDGSVRSLAKWRAG